MTVKPFSVPEKNKSGSALKNISALNPEGFGNTQGSPRTF